MTDESPLKLSIGYQLPDRYSLTEVVAEYRDAVREVYFPYFGFADGRGLTVRHLSDQREMERELKVLGGMGLRLHLLLNANCYGGGAVSRRLADGVREALAYLRGEFGLSGVTTTSLFVARLCKKEFPGLEVRASVNMGVGTPEAIGYLADYFDSFYVQRELNRHPERIRALRPCGKPLHLLANSGCLAYCPAHTFHDNLVAHEAEMDAGESEWPGFRGLCWEYYARPERRRNMAEHSTWLRPEEIDNYRGLVDGIKLATRSNHRLGTIVKAYAERSFAGNMMSLCEPDFSALAGRECR